MPGAAYEDRRRMIDMRNIRMSMIILQETLGSSPLFYILQKAASTHSFASDQEEIPMQYGIPGGAVWIDEGDTLPDGQDARRFMGYWANRYLAVGMRQDMLGKWKYEKNPERIFDEYEINESNAAYAMRQAIISGMWSGSGGKAPDGLSTVIQKLAPSAQTGTVTGINKATRAFWRNQYVQNTQNAGYVAPGTGIPYILLQFLDLLDRCTFGSQRPNIAVTTKAVFKTLRRALMEMSLLINPISKMEYAEYGYESFMIDGMLVIHDYNCPTDSLYMLRYKDNSQQLRTQNQTDHKVNFDSILESEGKPSKTQVMGGICLLGHSNIKRRTIDPRAPFKSLTTTSWIIDSFNVGYTSLQQQGVMGSDTGDRLSTW